MSAKNSALEIFPERSESKALKSARKSSTCFLGGFRLPAEAFRVLGFFPSYLARVLGFRA